jgi:hypothetical protein
MIFRRPADTRTPSELVSICIDVSLKQAKRFQVKLSRPSPSRHQDPRKQGESDYDEDVTLPMLTSTLLFVP